MFAELGCFVNSKICLLLQNSLAGSSSGLNGKSKNEDWEKGFKIDANDVKQTM
jgi:hypothetical protein